jgi:hypothetical protein
MRCLVFTSRSSYIVYPRKAISNTNSRLKNPTFRAHKYPNRTLRWTPVRSSGNVLATVQALKEFPALACASLRRAILTDRISLLMSVSNPARLRLQYSLVRHSQTTLAGLSLL